METARFDSRAEVGIREGRRLLGALWAGQDGLTTVEYALLLMIMVGGIISVWAALGSDLDGSATHSVGEIPNP